VSTEGGRVGIWTRHLLDEQQTSAPKRQRRTRSLGMSEIA
jgi:hypothetical protein